MKVISRIVPLLLAGALCGCATDTVTYPQMLERVAASRRTSRALKVQYIGSDEGHDYFWIRVPFGKDAICQAGTEETDIVARRPLSYRASEWGPYLTFPDSPAPRLARDSVALTEHSAGSSRATAEPLYDFAFVNAPLDYVLATYSEVTGKPARAEPGVEASISGKSERRLTVVEYAAAIALLLERNGIRLVADGTNSMRAVRAGPARD